MGADRPSGDSGDCRPRIDALAAVLAHLASRAGGYHSLLTELDTRHQLQPAFSRAQRVQRYDTMRDVLVELMSCTDYLDLVMTSLVEHPDQIESRVEDLEDRASRVDQLVAELERITTGSLGP